MGLPRLFADTTPLREYPHFRNLWIGYLISQTGSQLTVVAVAYQVYLLTHSSLDVGLIALAQLVPAIIGPMIAGTLADAMDRTRLLLIIQSSLACCSIGLALNSVGGHPRLWLLYLLSALISGLSTSDNPTRSALIMSIVPREQFIAANVLRSTVQQVSLVAGPSLGGILLAAAGVEVVYWVDVASFAASIAAVLTLPALRPADGGTRPGLRSFLEGFAFLRGRQAIQGAFVADLNATILGMPTSLFPALGLVAFHGGPGVVGLLYAAPGAGALLGVVLSGWTSAIRRPGWAVVIAIVIWGVAITVFGLVPWLPLALFLLALAGWADVISAVFRNAIIQFEAPDRLRGRLTSIQTAVVQSGPRLGQAEAGAVAALSTAQLSVVTGGLGCVVGIALIGYLMPRFLHYRIPEPEPALAARPAATA